MKWKRTGVNNQAGDVWGIEMQIAKDTIVVIEYDVRLDDGSFVKGENGPVSMNFVAGYGQILPALETTLTGSNEGDFTEFVIPACDAFGDRDESEVRTRTFDEFPPGRLLEAGKWAVATNPETLAQYSYFVREKTGSAVVLDFNHPLAGKDLHYRVKVVRVRPGLPEELEHLRPCEHGEETEAAEA
jgi:FKBP-type peptidyl-prolyl cis-trans isomerase SlyD